MRKFVFGILVLLLALPTFAQDDVVELRFQMYQDGNEAEVMQDLVDRFNEEHDDINVVLDIVPYDFVVDQLPLSVASNEGPDIARITAFAQMRGEYLDLRPLLSDPSMLEDNFNGAILAAFREEGEDNGLYGFPDQYTLTIPYINETLFELAEVDIPEGVATWEEWADLAAEVADINGLDYAIAVDPRIHRMSGPAISYGAELFDEDGNFTIDSEGFRAWLQEVRSWHEEGLMPPEIWAANTFPNEAFTGGELVMIMSGTWALSGFNDAIDGAFDWGVVPSPAGPDGEHGTSIPGGAAIVSFAKETDTGDSPREEAIATFMEYLMQPEVYKEYVERSLFVPAHIGVSQGDADELSYETDSEVIASAFQVLSGEAAHINDDAAFLNLHPFARVYYSQGNQRVAQYIIGELSLDEAIEALQSDIDDAIANAETE